jgi:hypothetical protein
MTRVEGDSRHNRATSWLFWGGAVAVGVALVPLYFFNPVEHSFFPKCFFHSLTGLDCPGCGGLRATHQLLHGDFLAALKLNALFVGLLPVGAFFGLRQLVFLKTGRLWPQPFRSARWAAVIAALIIAFGILRNVPWRAFLGT